MDENSFVNYVKNTPMLTKDRKVYYISKTADYSPELRQKMVVIIQSHEKEIIALGAQKNLERRQENAEIMHQRMLQAEKIHAQEVAAAENQLDADLEKAFN